MKSDYPVLKRLRGIASEYATLLMPAEDLVMVGWAALWEKGTWTAVHSAMRHYKRDYGSLIRIPAHRQTKASNNGYSYDAAVFTQIPFDTFTQHEAQLRRL